MLFKKPIKTSRSKAGNSPKGNTLIVFPSGIRKITPLQRDTMKRNATNPHLARGFAETMGPDE